VRVADGAQQAVRHPEANRQDMKAFVNRPIPRLLRYQLLMESVLKETPADHEDRAAIPQLLEVIKSLGKETEPGVAGAEQKVEVWRYNTHLVFKPGEQVVRARVGGGGKSAVLSRRRTWTSSMRAGLSFTRASSSASRRQALSGTAGASCSCSSSTTTVSGVRQARMAWLTARPVVMCKPKEKDGVTKYNVTRRVSVHARWRGWPLLTTAQPIPLDLLTLTSFSDPPTQRAAGLLRNLRGGGGGSTQHDGPSANAGPASADGGSATDARAVYPCTIHHNGRVGGLYVLYAESAAARAEWKQKLEEAIGLRKVVQESNKVFEPEVLSSETFLVPSLRAGPAAPAWNGDTLLTGKVTCSIPFSACGRGACADGC
jgi:hypothetical protein